jgi:gamma-glutamyltranspeptidase/glutathione hydrolase/leukotriene-C4 hydrolase
MLVYDHKRRRVLDVVDFREVAPASLPSTVAPGDGSVYVGVPGFLRGLHTAHVAHGLLPWRDLIEPSIQLAR